MRALEYQADRRRLPKDTVYHRLAGAPGAFRSFAAGIAYCGAKASAGAHFTSTFRLVNCPACREAIKRNRELARERFRKALAATGG